MSLLHVDLADYDQESRDAIMHEFASLAEDMLVKVVPVEPPDDMDNPRLCWVERIHLPELSHPGFEAWANGEIRVVDGEIRVVIE